jgi:hypothetical protein
MRPANFWTLMGAFLLLMLVAWQLGTLHGRVGQLERAMKQSSHLEYVGMGIGEYWVARTSAGYLVAVPK